MKKLWTIILLSLAVHAVSQNNPKDEVQSIVAEGKKLYKSEMASWYGSDLLREKYGNATNVGGYFSYIENKTAKCIFFSKADGPRVVGSVSFDSTYNMQTAVIDLNERNFNSIESELYKIRKTALDAIHTDTLFKTYTNANLNLVPLIDGKGKRVYVLTGPRQEGVVLFGNDYLLTFDKDDNILIRKKLHDNLIPVFYDVNGEDEKNTGNTMHSHLSSGGDFITATDICTLMLYAKYAKWKRHEVLSKKYLNIWNCETDELTIVPRK